MEADGQSGFCRSVLGHWPLEKASLSDIEGVPALQKGDSAVRVFDEESQRNEGLVRGKSSEDLRPPFPDGIRRLIQEIDEALRDAFELTAEEWDLSFREWGHCDYMVAIFLHLAEVYAGCTAGLDLDPGCRSEILTLLLACMSQSPEQALAATPVSVLSREVARVIVDAFDETRGVGLNRAFSRVGGCRFDEAGGDIRAPIADLFGPKGWSLRPDTQPLLCAADVIIAVAAGSGEEKMVFVPEAPDAPGEARRLLVRELLAGCSDTGDAGPLRVLRVEVTPELGEGLLLAGLASLESDPDHVAFFVSEELDLSRVIFDDATPADDPGRALLVRRLLRARVPDLPVVDVQDEDGRRKVLHGRDRLAAARAAGQATCRAYCELGTTRSVVDWIGTHRRK
jgi:hypothetical protein